jgi:hypothetical protein
VSAGTCLSANLEHPAAVASQVLSPRHRLAYGDHVGRRRSARSGLAVRDCSLSRGSAKRALQSTERRGEPIGLVRAAWIDVGTVDDCRTVAVRSPTLSLGELDR